MSLWEQGRFTIQHEDASYTFTELNIDISDEFNFEKGSLVLSHKIEGFKVSIYLIHHYKDGGFFFATKVIDDDNEHGLFVTLQDDEVYETAVGLVTSINQHLKKATN